MCLKLLVLKPLYKSQAEQYLHIDHYKARASYTSATITLTLELHSYTLLIMDCILLVQLMLPTLLLLLLIAKWQCYRYYIQLIAAQRLANDGLHYVQPVQETQPRQLYRYGASIVTEESLQQRHLPACLVTGK